MDHTSHETGTPARHIHGSVKSYTIGFILSIVLTLIAFYLVADQTVTGVTLYATITVLCIAQVLVQLLFFLHLGEEDKPRWNLLIFLFMALVLGIIVFGSLWIMYNLNYRMMPPMNHTEMKM